MRHQHRAPKSFQITINRSALEITIDDTSKTLHLFDLDVHGCRTLTNAIDKDLQKKVLFVFGQSHTKREEWTWILYDADGCAIQYIGDRIEHIDLSDPRLMSEYVERLKARRRMLDGVVWYVVKRYTISGWRITWTDVLYPSSDEVIAKIDGPYKDRRTDPTPPEIQRLEMYADNMAEAARIAEEQMSLLCLPKWNRDQEPAITIPSEDRIGLKQSADLLGMSKQRLNGYISRKTKPLFPEPVENGPRGKLYSVPAVLSFKKYWEWHTGGRKPMFDDVRLGDRLFVNNGEHEAVVMEAKEDVAVLSVHGLGLVELDLETVRLNVFDSYGRS